MRIIDEKIEHLEYELTQWKHAADVVDENIEEQGHALESSIEDLITEHAEYIINDLCFDLDIDTDRLEVEISESLRDALRNM